MGIVLGKLKLVLRNDIRILVEYNEPHGAASGHQWLPGKRHMHMTHVVPQSSDPTNLSCLSELGIVETDEAVD